jgi:cell wall-associated NlpC family hydrolase
MHYGICLLSVVPCRKEPAGTSEMVTQLLFGEHYTVLEQTEDWLKIKTAFDHYECWLSAKQHHKLSDTGFHHLQKQSPVYSADLFQIISEENTDLHFPIAMGSVLPDYKNHKLKIEGRSFLYDGATASLSQKKSAEQLIETARLLLHAPYLWGGRAPLGIDCSGFTQLVYKLNGYALPRDAYQQVELGIPLSFVEEAEAGDLAFFDNEEGRIVHVGIVMNDQQIIHASGSVRIDKYDHYGIFNKSLGKYSHSMRVIKRVLEG